MNEKEKDMDRSTTETVDFEGAPPPLIEGAMDLDGLLAHLEDAHPTIAVDASESISPPARYVIGRELGSGSIGQVIEAKDQHLGRQVAIKMLLDGEGLSRDGIARFLAEAQITAQLEHPSVVPVHEIGIMPGGMPYFSMKLLSGRSLGDIINLLRIGDRDARRQYNFIARLRLFQRICQGMAYAHDKGVVHRDLKPENILIGKYGEVQIMDWGLAKTLRTPDMDGGVDIEEMVHTVRQASGMMTFDGSIAGTPAYMSPEQARGEYAAVGPHSDVFALGLVLAELMSLVRVYRQPKMADSLEAARTPQSPVLLSQLAPGVRFSSGIERVVSKATHPDIRQRYAHAGELTEDIVRVIEEQLPSISLKRTLLTADPAREDDALSAEADFLAGAGWMQLPPSRRWFWAGAAAVLALEGLVWLIRFI